MDEPVRALSKLLERNVSVGNLRLGQRTLEDVFIQLTGEALRA